MASLIYDEEIHQNKRLGSATECALLSLAESMGYKYENYRNPANELLSIPFNSTRKRMTSVYRTNNSNKHIVYVKGAPEILLPYCSKIIAKDGVEQDLNQSSSNNIENSLLKRNAKIGYRSLLLAYKSISSADFNLNDYNSEESYEVLEKGLTIIAIVGIEDPLRDNVKEADRKSVV